MQVLRGVQSNIPTISCLNNFIRDVSPVSVKKVVTGARYWYIITIIKTRMEQVSLN